MTTPFDQPPAWVADAIFYQIFPDRFAKSDRLPKPRNLEPWDEYPTFHGYKGGDLYGVLEHLDWLTDLGVNAIYFNPIFQSASNHRYHTHDFFKVDPLLGGEEAFDELLRACHSRGIRVVLDGVFNHASRGFFQFNDLLESGSDSPWIDWWHVDRFPLQAYNHEEPAAYGAWWGLHALPKFNTENPEVREYLMRVGEYWVERGIDGWRLDVPEEITTEGLLGGVPLPGAGHQPRRLHRQRDLGRRQRLHQRRPLRRHHELPAHRAHLPVRRRTPRRRRGGGRHHLRGAAPAGRRRVRRRGRSHVQHVRGRPDAGPPQPARLTRHAASDDGLRRQIPKSVILSTLLQFTFPGAPSVYYGDEIGLEGKRDPDCRRGFPWEHESSWNQEVLEATKSLIALRKSCPALRTGEYNRLWPHPGNYQIGLYVFERKLDGEHIVVAVNSSKKAESAEVPGIEGTEFQTMWGTGGISDDGETTGIALKARSCGSVEGELAPTADRPPISSPRRCRVSRQVQHIFGAWLLNSLPSGKGGRAKRGRDGSPLIPPRPRYSLVSCG